MSGINPDAVKSEAEKLAGRIETEIDLLLEIRHREAPQCRRRLGTIDDALETLTAKLRDIKGIVGNPNQNLQESFRAIENASTVLELCKTQRRIVAEDFSSMVASDPPDLDL